ncbi:MAG: AAA family ATPase, partial [Clostridia bacterium]|nr:AAA family ATPase [Clostridia bacterium]
RMIGVLFIVLSAGSVGFRIAGSLSYKCKQARQLLNLLQILKNEKIDLAEKIDPKQKEEDRYLRYVYSPKFVADVQKFLRRSYDSLYGLFTGDECKEFISAIVAACKKQIFAYETIKNASLRVRRAVLGEIKERETGGLYYTKPFRELMNCILDIDDFFDGTLKSENAKIPDYFYRQLLSFYKSASFVAKRTDRVVEEAMRSLETLENEIVAELTDLRRFKRKIGTVETYLYAERIERREQILKEIEKIRQKVRLIGDLATAFGEFYAYLRGEKNFTSLGGSRDFVDVVRYFYRETVKKYKVKYGMTSRKLYRSDAYALTLICSLLGRRLSPTHSHVFVDEGQDVSPSEYALLRAVNPKAAFNIFGDTEQNVTDYRGVKNWAETFPDFKLFTLNQNYRNTNQIVDFVSSTLEVDMQPIGFDGDEVKRISPREIAGFFKDKKGLKAVICAESAKETYARKSYNDLSEKGKISQNKINLMTVYESKGLEFTAVVVIPDGMTPNERYIAYTRALKDLAVLK